MRPTKYSPRVQSIVDADFEEMENRPRSFLLGFIIGAFGAALILIFVVL